VVRQHWGVENSLHWRLDVVMNEDQDRTRMGHGGRLPLCFEVVRDAE
jgi:predicted transposase YbfD/YdcC